MVVLLNAITASTITTRAFLKAVNQAYLVYADYQKTEVRMHYVSCTKLNNENDELFENSNERHCAENLYLFFC